MRIFNDAISYMPELHHQLESLKDAITYDIFNKKVCIHAYEGGYVGVELSLQSVRNVFQWDY
jgi:hypothetical protein